MLPCFSYWGSEGSLYGPAPCTQAAHQGVVPNAQGFAPLFHGARLPMPCYQHIVSLVVSLLLARGPVAVVRGIAFIVIPSLYRKPVRWGPHICQELFKAPPFRMYRDMAAAIIREPKAVFVSASGQHGCPYTIYPRTSHSVGNKVSFGSSLVKAPARFSLTTTERAPGNHFSGPARAYTHPMSFQSSSYLAPIEDCKSVKYLPSKVYESLWHCRNLHQRLSSLKKYRAGGVMNSPFWPLSLSPQRV